MDDLRDKLRELRIQSRRMQQSREVEDLTRQLGDLERLAPGVATQATPRRLRYAGSVAGSDVRGARLGNVVVDDSGDEVVIITRDATIRIRPSGKDAKPGKDKDRK